MASCLICHNLRVSKRKKNHCWCREGAWDGDTPIELAMNWPKGRPVTDCGFSHSLPYPDEGVDLWIEKFKKNFVRIWA